MKHKWWLLVAVVLFLPTAYVKAEQQPTSIKAPRIVAGAKTDGQFVIWTAKQTDQANSPSDLHVATITTGDQQVLAATIDPGSTEVLLADGIVVWAVQRATGWQLRARILATGQTIVIADAQLYQPNSLVLDHQTVGWIEQTADRQVSTLRVKTLINGNETVVATGVLDCAALSGTTITWWQTRDQATTPPEQPISLYKRDLASMAAPTQLAESMTSIYGGFRCQMNQQWVVWAKPIGHTRPAYVLWQIEAVPLAGGDARIISQNQPLYSSFFRLRGDEVVYNATQYPAIPGNAVAQTTLVFATLGAQKPSMRGQPGNVQQIAVGDRYLLWSKIENGSDTLWGYDPQTDSAFPIAAVPGGANVYAESHFFPQTGGGVATWIEGTGAAATIHVAPISQILPTARHPTPTNPQPNEPYFSETGHSLRGEFNGFWQRNGGLPVFGFPLTDEFVEKTPGSEQGWQVQYLERQRFEYHPENTNTPYVVLLGRLGVEMLQRQGRDWQQEPKGKPGAAHFFPQTGHAIAPEFWDYWRTHGLELGDRGLSEREALALFGFPITEPQLETNSSGDRVLTQWFERARFEYHPNNPAASRVLLGRLAADLLAERGW